MLQTTTMKHTIALLLAGLFSTGAALAAEVDLSKLPKPSDQKDVTYEKDIRPLFEASCFNCHGNNPNRRPSGGLRLDTLEGALKGTKDGKVIQPGDSAKSQLVVAVARIDPETMMPPPPRPRRNPRPADAGGTNAPAGGTNAPGGGMQRGPQGPPPKPLTAEQVGLIRAWIDQGAK
jgi:hypothetical protein